MHRQSLYYKCPFLRVLSGEQWSGTGIASWGKKSRYAESSLFFCCVIFRMLIWNQFQKTNRRLCETSRSQYSESTLYYLKSIVIVICSYVKCQSRSVVSLPAGLQFPGVSETEDRSHGAFFFLLEEKLSDLCQGPCICFLCQTGILKIQHRNTDVSSSVTPINAAKFYR